MNRQQGIIPTYLLLIALLIIFSILGVFIYYEQLNGVLSTISSEMTQTYSSITPSSPPNSMPNYSLAPLESSSCNCSWAITSETDVEFLVISPSGQQTGYLKASDSYINNIPDASYGIEYGIADDTGQSPPLPDMNYFGINNPENGVYELQVIGKQPGEYHLDVSFTYGPMDGKTSSIDGMLVTNQIDQYKVTLPEGEIQKIGH